MSQSADNELLDAFLVEAGELLDTLDGQLIDLERDPQDVELLNAVFRAFHTVKGGAGFLGATAMVQLCHHGEDLLNEARNRRLNLTSDHVDALLQALDQVNVMMQALGNGEALPAASSELMARLCPAPAPTRPSAPATATAAAMPVADAPAATAAAQPVQTLDSASADPVTDAFVAMLDTACERHDGRGTEDAEPIDDAEFEALLDELHGPSKAPGSSVVSTDAGDTVNDAIDDSEFEHLLDELHGTGKAPGDTSPAAADTSEGAIDDSEFEALLDQLYGTGKAPGAAADTAAEHAPSGSTSSPSTTSPPHDPDADREPAISQVSTPQAVESTPRQDAADAPGDSKSPAPSAAAPTPRARSARRAASGEAAAAETTVRVDTARMDALVNAAGELILVRNRLTNLATRGADPAMDRAIAELDRVAENMQSAALRMRMQPIGRLFQRFPRIVRDLARQLGKSVELHQDGADTNLDRTLVESLADPLIHLLRNAVDHGLEDAATRAQSRKPATGNVHLSAGQEGERIVIRIRDDGRGMDPDVLRDKAVQKGLIDAERAAQLQPAECFDLIFAPGFSTREEISDISGRGVGMDVVKTHVAELGGSITIDSQVGVGTTVAISIPLTLAILRVLMVRVGSRLLALPLSSVKEVFELTATQVRELDGSVVAAHRGQPLPLTDLGRWAGIAENTDVARHVVLLHVGHRHVGCVVHEVLGREDVMIKPLGALLHHVSGIAGATITGDGRIALVLDLDALTEQAALLAPLRTHRPEAS